VNQTVAPPPTRALAQEIRVVVGRHRRAAKGRKIVASQWYNPACGLTVTGDRNHQFCPEMMEIEAAC
jgi:hypothetical protein